MLTSIADGADSISFVQFLKYMANLKWEEMENRARENFMEFGELDDDGKMGFVTEDGLRSIFKRFIGNVPDEDIAVLIQECEKDESGEVSFEDFFRLLMGKYKEGSITKDAEGNFWWQSESEIQKKQLEDELRCLREEHAAVAKELNSLRRKYNECVRDYEEQLTSAKEEHDSLLSETKENLEHRIEELTTQQSTQVENTKALQRQLQEFKDKHSELKSTLDAERKSLKEKEQQLQGQKTGTGKCPTLVSCKSVVNCSTVSLEQQLDAEKQNSRTQQVLTTLQLLSCLIVSANIWLGQSGQFGEQSSVA